MCFHNVSSLDIVIGQPIVGGVFCESAKFLN